MIPLSPRESVSLLLFGLAILAICGLEIGVLVRAVYRRSKGRSARRILLAVPAIVLHLLLVTVLGCMLYAYFIEPNWIEVHSLTLHTPKLKAETFRIVQISDLHCDVAQRNEERAVQIINGLKPDVVVATGDYHGSATRNAYHNGFDYAPIAGQAGDLVSLLSFVVGTAATAGGAIASVILSNIALRLSLEAEKRETSTFAADRIDSAAAHFSRIASGMNRLYAATALVEDKARFYERQYVYGMTGLSAHEQDRLNRELAGPCAQVADALETMAAALDEALCDEFARYALVKGMELQAASGRLPRTKDAMARLPQAGRTPSLSDLPEVVAILRSAAYSMREDARSIVVNAWRRLPEDLKVSPDSHVIVERPAVDFILMGNMTDLRSGQLTDAGGAFCVRRVRQRPPRAFPRRGEYVD